ncbi:hypothetical protein ASC84_04720 [Acinetobacter sp. Root1280]|uniref:hypothetical protein n=1 Tax=Acinetobacter sp. Root1280 TaxID=1736444 RepID=UPI0006F70E84|nr:hypothetical protein [Acinetobacter sp. Root1280]KQW98059.1 hypothetical protein ASC84_04720 [Acinetobacter sp. Root1280]
MEMLLNPERLKKDVQVTAYKRPIKIAFLISEEESENNHLILDEIFKYSYTCWAGTRFLIIPFGTNNDKNYLEWLSFYDADIVYSYLKLEKEKIEEIEKLNSPGSLLEHKYGNERKFFSVNIPFYSPIGSISTIHSPEIYAFKRSNSTNKIINLITQFSPKSGDRFVTDNFGNRINVNNYLHEVSGFFEVFCLSKERAPDNNNADAKLIESEARILDLLADQEATTVARLANIHSEAFNPIYHDFFSKSFAIVIGSSVQDRISFWNYRHFHNSTYSSLGSLILTEEHFNNDDFLKYLGKYLNNLNFIGEHGHNYVSLYSSTISKTKLKHIKEKLQDFTYNNININSYFSEKIYPNSFFKLNTSLRPQDISKLSISENPANLFTSGPRHLKYLPTNFQSFGSGHFAIECDIDRHNNLSKYSNVIDTWIIPQRAYISKNFGKDFFRISRNKIPTCIIGNIFNPFNRNSNNNEILININLPDDLMVLNTLLSQRNLYNKDDSRYKLDKPRISHISISDKGKNFNGVISLFNHLNIASNFLTNNLWKKVFQDASQRNGKEDYIYTLFMFEKFQQKNKELYISIKNKMNFKNIDESRKYLAACFKDALNILVEYKIFCPIHTWSCEYCGYKNIRTVDSIKLKNNCDICEKTHIIPVGNEFSWDYLLNKFVHKTMVEHCGLPVLWALDYIQNSNTINSFMYLPEVNIFYDYKDLSQLNEIDLLGVYGGVLFAGEAKRSADYFFENDREKSKFLDVIQQINPDEAFLIFEQYSEDPLNVEPTKKNMVRFKDEFNSKFNNIILKIITFEDFLNRNHSVVDYGAQSRYVCAFLDTLE